MDPQISFIILTYNSEQYLERCFDSIMSKCGKEGISYEILVIDNGSKDGSVSIIRRYQSEYPHIFKPRFLCINIGTTCSRNSGLWKSLGEYICILDSDTVILDGSIKSVLDLLDNNSEIGIVAPKLLLPDGSIQNSVKKFPTMFHKTIKMLKVIPRVKVPNADFYKDFPFKGKRYVDSAISACWFFRKGLLDLVGVFDEKIFYAPEDLDYCKRVHIKNKRIMYFPDLSILHYTQQVSHRSPFSIVSISHLIDVFYYFKKHGGWFTNKRQWHAGTDNDR